MRKLFVLSAAVLLTAVGCQTSLKQEFTKVNEGMVKYEVLEILGSPQVSKRWRGQDKWIYRFYERDAPVTKEVYFKEGKVAYAGDPIKPKISAVEQDKLNEKSNRAQEARLKKEALQKRMLAERLRSRSKLFQDDADEKPPQFKEID